MSGVELGVIVVSWNSERFLDGCLGSLLAQTGVSLEIVVVDNGSSDGSVARVRSRYPGVRLIELGTNRGFCTANNEGLRATRAPFVLFANSDIILDPRFARCALDAFARDPRIGLVGGKLLRFDRATVDSAGQFLTRARRIVDRGYGAPDGPHTAEEGYVFGVCGAAMACRRGMVEEISVRNELFDGSYFAFSEDLDVAWRARIAGWRAWYAPEALGYHFRGGSEARSLTTRLPALLRRPRQLRYHIVKNRWLTLLKNDSPAAVLRDLPFIAARDAALLTLGIVASPGLVLDLLRAGPELKEALARRREFLGSPGVWGERRPGARRSWVRWSNPRPEEPAGR